MISWPVASSRIERSFVQSWHFGAVLGMKIAKRAITTRQTAQNVMLRLNRDCFISVPRLLLVLVLVGL